MRTFDEILRETIEDDFLYENVTTETAEKRAAKEYAKQWIHESAILAGKDASIGPYAVVTILKLIQQVDAQ